MSSIKNMIHSMKGKYQARKAAKQNRQPNPRVEKAVAHLNKYSLIYHGILACLLCFVIECISRRSFISALTFVGGHTAAYLYNSFIIFTSLSLAYLVRRRALVRLLVSGFWLFLGTVNGCILAKRVTPFGFTDLKCLSDLFEMKNTNYFTATEAILVVCVVGAFLAFCIWMFVKGPKFQGKTHKYLSPLFVAAICLLLPLTTKAAQSTNIVASYFSNIAQGYENYGFVYGFSSSVVDRGMSKPENYSKETVDEIQTAVHAAKKETTVTSEDAPNIIVILLESFIDPYDVNFLKFSEDPVPNFHNLYNNYSSGYLTVPVVGAGTANTEFEVLTGMSLQYFGTGEYPYKTTLKKTDCESVASDLSAIGYGTHVVHNNGGNFYSRANAFSMMGFDTFTSKECMNIHEYTPLGDWPTDDILINETIKAMDATPDQADLVYTITVQGHGDYPTEKILTNPEIKVSGAADEGSNNSWEYYVNMIHEVDKFIANLIDEVSKRDEKTMIVMFGDHLPTMGLEESDMAAGDIFKTKYITWNNFGLEKQDADLTSYQLLANTMDQLGIHEGTLFTAHQTLKDSETYINDVEQLQYDLLYGERYAYNGEDKYPASDLVMGIDDVVISNIWNTTDGRVCISGSNFTPWTKIYVNGTKVPTTFISSSMLRISGDNAENGDTITANIVGSSSTIFRTSNEMTYYAPEQSTETETPADTGSDVITPPLTGVSIDPDIEAALKDSSMNSDK